MAADKTEAMAKCGVILKQLWNTIPEARRLSKLSVRHAALERFEKHRVADTENFVRLVSTDKVQGALGMYIASLSAKK